MELHKRYEREVRREPGVHRRCTAPGTRTTRAHPFFMWYWGENGRQHIGRVIVVGADNEYIPR